MCFLSTVVAQNTYKMSVAKPQEKRTFGRPRHRWQDDIKMDHKYSRGFDSCGSREGAVVCCWKHCNELPASVKRDQLREWRSGCWFITKHCCVY